MGALLFSSPRVRRGGRGLGSHYTRTVGWAVLREGNPRREGGGRKGGGRWRLSFRLSPWKGTWTGEWGHQACSPGAPPAHPPRPSLRSGRSPLALAGEGHAGGRHGEQGQHLGAELDVRPALSWAPAPPARLPETACVEFPSGFISILCVHRIGVFSGDQRSLRHVVGVGCGPGFSLPLGSFLSLCPGHCRGLNSRRVATNHRRRAGRRPTAAPAPGTAVTLPASARSQREAEATQSHHPPPPPTNPPFIPGHLFGPRTVEHEPEKPLPLAEEAAGTAIQSCDGTGCGPRGSFHYRQHPPPWRHLSRHPGGVSGGVT